MNIDLGNPEFADSSEPSLAKHPAPDSCASPEMAGALLESASQAILSIDRSGTIVLCNRKAEEMFGYRREELLGAPVEILIPSSKRAQHAQMRAGYLHRPSVRPMGTGLELSGRRKDGSEFPIEVGLSHIETADGAFGIAFVSDISLRKRLEQQLLQAQKMEAVGRLAGGVAHDFNNMLMVIAGYGSMLLEELPDEGSPLRNHVEEMLAATNRAAALTGQLLAFSRQQSMRLEVINLNTLITGIETMLHRVIPEDIVLEMVLQSDLAGIKADAGQIEQAIVNLVANARDAMPAGGSITIESANVRLDDSYARTHAGVQPGEFVMIAVSDTGMGMDTAVLRQIFEPFFTTKAPGKGNGLGLATLYGMVKQSGGDVWVYSESGKGTTFKLYFPKAHDPLAVLPDAITVPAPQSGNETILVVEDERSVRELTVNMLTRLGYRPLACSGGEEALELSRTYPGNIHLLLTDVVMPRMSGPQLAVELAGTRPKMKVLYLSGYTETAAVQHGIVDASVNFLAKPFSRVSLGKALREILEGR